MMSRLSFIPALLVLSLSLAACGDGSSRRLSDPNSGNTGSSAHPDQAIDLTRLEPLAGDLKSLGLLPGLYSVTLHQTSGTTKNQIFEEWLQKKLNTVDPLMRDMMVEWKVVDQKDSWQEYVGTFRTNRANDDTAAEIADMFLYAADISPDERKQIETDILRLKASGMEFGFNGFDTKGCGVTPEVRQMDDYAESPLFIEPSTGKLYEFRYNGPCRN